MKISVGRLVFSVMLFLFCGAAVSAQHAMGNAVKGAVVGQRIAVHNNNLQQAYQRILMNPSRETFTAYRDAYNDTVEERVLNASNPNAVEIYHKVRRDTLTALHLEYGNHPVFRSLLPPLG